MALFKIDVEKRLDGEFWTNRYIVQAPELAAANASRMRIVDAERQFHRLEVEFTKVRVSDMVPGTDLYTVTPLGLFGTLTKNGSYLPLFNVVRADFTAEGSGRPSRKYYRLPLCAGDVDSDYRISSTLRNLIKDVLDGMLDDLANDAIPMVDPDNQALYPSVVFQPIAMRQLRRGTKQRSNPIL